MIQWLSKQITNKKGFTLVELLVVIAIMGILLAVGIPKLGQYRKDASDTASLATAAAIYNARATYLARHGSDGLASMTDEILGRYLAGGEVPEYIGGDLDDTGYGINTVFVKDANGAFTIGYPDIGSVMQFASASEALASITTNSFLQTNDTSLWVHHADRTGYNCPDVTIAASIGGYTFEFVQGSIQTWNSTWDGNGSLIPTPQAHIYYRNATNLKFITHSETGISGTFVLRATKGSDTATRTISYSQGLMVGTVVPAMVFN